MAGLMHGLGTIPVHREGGRAALHALDAAVPRAEVRRTRRHLPGGHALARRPPLPRTHRCRAARDAGQRPGRAGRHPRHRERPAEGPFIPRLSCPHARDVIIKFGTPIDFSDRSDDMSTMRAITDEIMIEIQKLSGQEYTGRYAHVRRPPATKARGRRLTAAEHQVGAAELRVAAASRESQRPHVTAIGRGGSPTVRWAPCDSRCRQAFVTRTRTVSPSPTSPAKPSSTGAELDRRRQRLRRRRSPGTRDGRRDPSGDARHASEIRSATLRSGLPAGLLHDPDHVTGEAFGRQLRRDVRCRARPRLRHPAATPTAPDRRPRASTRTRRPAARPRRRRRRRRRRTSRPP